MRKNEEHITCNILKYYYNVLDRHIPLEYFYNISETIEYLFIFSNISECSSRKVAVTYFAIFDSNGATIFHLQLKI